MALGLHASAIEASTPMVSPDLQNAVGLAVAALVGLAVGIERERSGKATGPTARFAGVRTFFLIGLLGGLSSWLSEIGPAWTAPALLLGAGALVVAAYATAVINGAGADGTTEVAALVVLALGAAAGAGQLAIAGGAGALVVLALSEKARIREAVRGISDQELRASFLFAVLALVILPLLPEGPYGPLGGIRPRALWIWVLIFTGVNLVGYFARKVVGEDRGYAVSGMLGGVLSSTAVALGFSRRSRELPERGGELGLGILAACTVLVPRVLVLTAALAPRVALALLPYLAPPLLIGLALVLPRLLRPVRAKGKGGSAPELKNPLGFWAAVRLALVFQAVLMMIFLVRERFGAAGILASAAVLGLTDVDALTLSMSKLQSDELAARAVAIGVLSNTLLKLVLTLVLGAPSLRRVASTGLAALALGSAGGLWIGWQLVPALRGP
jgi:uncharacterized membrane protein (DUF4010 family)